LVIDPSKLLRVVIATPVVQLSSIQALQGIIQDVAVFNKSDLTIKVPTPLAAQETKAWRQKQLWHRSSS
jgi:hypothetical protein